MTTVNPEHINIINEQFNRLWNSCVPNSSDNREKRKQTLSKEYARVFLKVRPIELVPYAADKWIEKNRFFPTVSEISELMDDLYDEFTEKIGYVPPTPKKRYRLPTPLVDEINPE